MYLYYRCEFASHFLIDTSDLWLSRIFLNDSPVSSQTIVTWCTVSLIVYVKQHDALRGCMYTATHPIFYPLLTHAHITGVRCSEALLETSLDLRVGMPVYFLFVLSAFRLLKKIGSVC